jgi:hypothetical protein
MHVDWIKLHKLSTTTPPRIHKQKVRKFHELPKETASKFSFFLFPPSEDSINQCPQKDSNLRSCSYIFAHYGSQLSFFFGWKRELPHILHARFCLDGRKMIYKTGKSSLQLSYSEVIGSHLFPHSPSLSI